MSVLVPAVAEGLISHAVVMLPGSGADSERIADAMGATIMKSTGVAERDWQDAARIARGDWVLLLDAGEVPGQGWIGCIERHLMLQTSASNRSAILPLARMDGFIERIGLMFARRKASSGMVAPRSQIMAGVRVRKPVRLPVLRYRMQS